MVGETEMKIKIKYKISIQKQLIFSGDSNFQLSFIPAGDNLSIGFCKSQKKSRVYLDMNNFFSLQTVQKKALGSFLYD